VGCVVDHQLVSYDMIGQFKYVKPAIIFFIEVRLKTANQIEKKMALITKQKIYIYIYYNLEMTEENVCIVSFTSF
jgi:hypothetical protein